MHQAHPLCELLTLQDGLKLGFLPLRCTVCSFQYSGVFAACLMGVLDVVGLYVACVLCLALCGVHCFCCFLYVWLCFHMYLASSL